MKTVDSPSAPLLVSCLIFFCNVSNHPGRRRDMPSLLRAVEINTSASMSLFFSPSMFFSSTSEHQSQGSLKASICVEGSLLLGRCIDSEWSNWLWSIQFCPPGNSFYGWMDLDVLNTDASIGCRATESAASERTGGSRRRHFLFFYSACFSPGAKCFLPRQCGSSSAWPWTRQRPCFQPQWLPDKNQFIAAILLRGKLWMRPRVMWYSFGGDTVENNSKSLFCFAAVYFRSGPSLRRGAS